MRRPAWSTSNDHLYVIESSCGHIKIGRAEDVERRARELQNACPPSVRLTVLAIAEYHGDWEYGLHEAFAEHRVRGEWFAPAAGVRLKELIGRASFAAIVRELAKRTGNRKGQGLTGPGDRRGTDWRAKARREQTRRRKAKATRDRLVQFGPALTEPEL
jgi:hypothetical protein